MLNYEDEWRAFCVEVAGMWLTDPQKFCDKLRAHLRVRHNVSALKRALHLLTIPELSKCTGARYRCIAELRLEVATRFLAVDGVAKDKNPQIAKCAYCKRSHAVKATNNCSAIAIGIPPGWLLWEGLLFCSNPCFAMASGTDWKPDSDVRARRML